MKLNLGCGDNLFDGYINIDKYDKAADAQADITELPYEDNAIGAVWNIFAYETIKEKLNEIL